jgi:hypothetical protein
VISEEQKYRALIECDLGRSVAALGDVVWAASDRGHIPPQGTSEHSDYQDWLQAKALNKRRVLLRREIKRAQEEGRADDAVLYGQTLAALLDQEAPDVQAVA